MTDENKVVAVRVHHDEFPESPREWCNIGKMWCEHNRYNLGDKDAKDDLVEYIRNHRLYRDWWEDYDNPKMMDVDDTSSILGYAEKLGVIFLPLYLYDHGGITMSTGGFSCPWDSGQVGIIWVSREKAREELALSRVTQKAHDRVLDCLRAEVAVYDQYIQGDCWDIEVEYDDGETDSCGGFFGLDYETNGMLDMVPKDGHHLMEEACHYTNVFY